MDDEHTAEPDEAAAAEMAGLPEERQKARRVAQVESTDLIGMVWQATRRASPGGVLAYHQP